MGTKVSKLVLGTNTSFNLTTDKFEGLAIFLDTSVLLGFIPGSCLSILHSYANSRHPYGFPRIVAMLGDGQTEYDQAHDGDANSIGACTVNILNPTFHGVIF